MGIKTKVEQQERSVHTQNRLVNNYAEQLRSKVISNGHRQAILKEMQLELTAEQYRQPLRRFYKHNAIRSYDNEVEYGDTFSSPDQPLFNPLQTGGEAVQSVRKKVDNNYIKSKRSNGYIHTAQLRFTGNAKKVIDEAREAEKEYDELVKKSRFQKIYTTENKKKERRKESQKKQIEADLKNQKFAVAKADSDDSVAIEAMQTVAAGAATAAHFGGYIRTAVNGTGKAAGKIATAVKTHHIFSQKSSVKDFGHIATAVKNGVVNVAKDTGQQLIRTKIDKSTVTDTGTEAIKQGLTEIRYVDNARKAVLNTARTTVKAGRAIKNMPKNTKKRVKKIKKTAKRTKNAIVTAGKIIAKIVTSPIGQIILLVLAIILLLLFLIILIVTVISALISSLFSWLSSDSGSPEPAETVLAEYVEEVNGFIADSKAEISSIVDDFVCDRISYPPNSEITELNQFGNKEIDPIAPADVISILAVLRYRELDRQVSITEMQFTYDEIAEVTGKFFDFDYWYSYAGCTCQNCKREIHTTVLNPGTPEQSVVVHVNYYCDVEHQWLYGEVKNYSLEEVLESYKFNDEEMVLFTAYQEQVIQMLGGG